MISLDSYDVRNRTGEGLFIILRPSLYLFLKKIGLGGKELFRIMNPGTVTVQRISRNACCQPRLPDTANVAVRTNTVYKVILPGSTSSSTRSPSE
jgi:hypothetical protein